MLGISGVISCDGDDDIVAVPEYGVPVMEFRISGRAVDAKTGHPVKGIAVTHIHPEDKYERQDTTWTSEKGEFIVQRSSFPSDKMILKFTDVDGSENGEYSVEQVEVPLVLKEESQDGWMVGIYAADDVQVKLDPAAAEEE
jgi:putative lipoprotein (rSAM/lipoprotein system)